MNDIGTNIVQLNHPAERIHFFILDRHEPNDVTACFSAEKSVIIPDFSIPDVYVLRIAELTICLMFDSKLGWPQVVL